MITHTEMRRFRINSPNTVNMYLLAIGYLLGQNDAGVKLWVHDVYEVDGLTRVEVVAILVAMGYTGRPVVAERIHTRVTIMRLEES